MLFKPKVHKEYIKLVKDYQSVFNNEVGRNVLYDLMNQHNILSSTFDDNAIEMARQEGERNVILRVLSLLKESPMKLLERINEHEKTYKVSDPFGDEAETEI